MTAPQALLLIGVVVLLYAAVTVHLLLTRRCLRPLERADNPASLALPWIVWVGVAAVTAVRTNRGVRVKRGIEGEQLW
jgi:predicted nucleic acid-binding protein